MIGASSTGGVVSRYSCRYLDSTRPVYTLVAPGNARRPLGTGSAGAPLSTCSVYTVPFYSMSRGGTQNAVATFLHKHHAELQRAELASTLPEETLRYVSVEEHMLMDVSHLAYMLSMPLIVLINAQCDLEDRKEEHVLFYSARYLGDAAPLP